MKKILILTLSPLIAAAQPVMECPVNSLPLYLCKNTAKASTKNSSNKAVDIAREILVCKGRKNYTLVFKDNQGDVDSIQASNDVSTSKSMVLEASTDGMVVADLEINTETLNATARFLLEENQTFLQCKKTR